MTFVITGFFEGIDEYGRLVIAHNEPNRFGPEFRHTTKIIGKPSPMFIGKRMGNICIVNDFFQGDKVKVSVSKKKQFIRASKEYTYKLTINKMTLVP